MTTTVEQLPAWKREWQFHYLCDVFPDPTQEEVREMAESLKEVGQLQPIIGVVTPGGERLIVSGKRRLAGCDAAGIEPRIEWVEGKDALLLVEGLELVRRHASRADLAAYGERLFELHAASARERQRAGKKIDPDLVANLPQGQQPGRSRDKVAEATGESPRTVQSRRKVDRDGTPELQAAVQSGDVAPSRGAKLSDLSPAEQVEQINADKKRVQVLDEADRLADSRHKGHKAVTKAIGCYEGDAPYAHVQVCLKVARGLADLVAAGRPIPKEVQPYLTYIDSARDVLETVLAEGAEAE